MSKFLGKWKITEMEKWGLSFIDENGPGYFQFENDSHGYFMFGYVEGDLRFQESQLDNKHRVDFSWLGIDEMDAANGRGWFELVNDNEIYGEIYFHQGNNSWIKAERLED